MKYFWLPVFACTFFTPLHAQTESTAAEFPTIFYLHGRIIEEKGARPVHRRWGLYDYPAIVEALAGDGADVISEIRESGTDVDAYAQSVVDQIDDLIESGVAPSSIFVVGFSKGGVIAMYVSDKLDHPDVNFVLLASCGSWLSSKPEMRPTGHILSIHEETDRIGGSCEKFASRNADLGSFSELEISTGKEHGAFYLPRAEWVAPLMHWIEG